jgi:hypothetical protein
MVNFVETLFGLTAAAFVVAIVLRVMGRRVRARRTAVIALVVGAVAVILEIYLQLFR